MALTLFGTDNDVFTPFNHLSAFHHLLNRDSRPGRDIHLDVLEADNNFTIRADLPGVDKENIKVTADEGMVTVSVSERDDREQDTKRHGVRVHRMERTSAFVSRTIRMPVAAELDQITASYTDGVLHLNIPKKAQKARKTTVAIE